MLELIHQVKFAADAFRAAKDKRARMLANTDYLVKLTRIKLLIEYTSQSINQVFPSHLKQTPLHICASKGQIEIARLLLEAKATVDVTDEGGMTAFQRAMLAENYAVARLLLDYGADIDSRDTNKMTRFFWSVFEASEANLKPAEKEKRLAVCRQLLKLGANCQIPDGAYITALASALSRNYSKELLVLLLDHGAGIGCDFDQIYKYLKPEKRTSLQADLLRLTENKLLMFSFHRRWQFNAKAITTLDELEKAVAAGMEFNFKRLIHTVSKMLSQNLVHESEVTKYTELLDKLRFYQVAQEARQARRVPSLFKQTLKSVIKHVRDETINDDDKKIFAVQLESLPEDIKEKLAKEETKQLRIARANKSQ